MKIFGCNDIISATRNNNLKLVEELIKSCNIDYKDRNHKSAIFYAVDNCNIEILDLLIDNVGNLYIRDDRGLTIFHYIILNENNILIDYFINKKKIIFNIEKVKEEVKDIKVKDDRVFLNIIKKIILR